MSETEGTSGATGGAEDGAAGKEPAAKESAVKEPAAKKRAPKKPAAKRRGAGKSGGKRSAARKSAAKSEAKKPAAKKSGAKKRSTSRPDAEKPAPKKSGKKAADKATKGSGEGATSAAVLFANLTGRPVSFRFGGRVVRLGPRETSPSMPEHAARHPELRALCQRGVLRVDEAPAPSEPE